MAYLFKSYCYETIQDASNAVYSSFELPFGVIQSVSGTGSPLSISYVYQSNNALKTGTFNYSLATCTKLGFDNSFSGLTAVDSTLIGSSVVSVLIAAWAMKVVKRAL